MRNLAALLVFAGFVAAGLVSAWRARLSATDSRRRAWISAFLLYALGASFGAGLLQKELWPFCNWPLIAGVVPDTVQEMHIVGVDALGREHEIDYRAWEPMAFREMGALLTRYFPGLAPAAQDSIAAYLLSLAEARRREAAAGAGVGYLDRYLGPLAAPYFILHPKPWEHPAGVPAAPLVRLRFYWTSWNVVERARGNGAVRRRDVYAFPRQ